MEFIIFTEVYSAILEIITVSSSELEHSIKALSQRRTTLEPAIKIIFVLSSFAVNLGFFTSATDVPLELGKMQLCGYSFLPV